jgi:hypothetical protein
LPPTPTPTGNASLKGHDGGEDYDVATQKHDRAGPTDPLAQWTTRQAAGLVPHQRNGGGQQRQRNLVAQTRSRDGSERSGFPEPQRRIPAPHGTQVGIHAGQGEGHRCAIAKRSPPEAVGGVMR